MSVPIDIDPWHIPADRLTELKAWLAQVPPTPPMTMTVQVWGDVQGVFGLPPSTPPTLVTTAAPEPDPYERVAAQIVGPGQRVREQVRRAP